MIAAVVFTSAGATSAHNVDELLQQIYVTPMPQGVNVSVEMTPGSQVATGLLSLIDSDGNQVISTTEAAAHAETARSALTFMTDGRPVGVRLVHTTYPDVPLLVAGGGTFSQSISQSPRRLEASESPMATRQRQRPVRYSRGFRRT